MNFTEPVVGRGHATDQTVVTSNQAAAVAGVHTAKDQRAVVIGARGAP
jgi:hypothetical protein